MKFQQKNRCDWYLQNHSIILKAKTSFIKRLRLITKSGRFKKEKQNISANYRQLLNRFSISFYFRSQRFCECYFCNFYGKIKFVFRRIFLQEIGKENTQLKIFLTSLPLSLFLSRSHTQQWRCFPQFLRRHCKSPLENLTNPPTPSSRVFHWNSGWKMFFVGLLSLRGQMKVYATILML